MMFWKKGQAIWKGLLFQWGGNNTHTVITAHRGLPQNRLFTDLDKLEIGDRFYIVNLQETLAYQVDEIQVVEPTNFEPILIKPGHDYATLLTCTPYMINSHRLLVRGHRVDYVEAVEEQEMDDNRTSRIYQVLFFITLFILLLILYRRYRQYRIDKLKAKNQSTEIPEPIVSDNDDQKDKNDIKLE